MNDFNFIQWLAIVGPIVTLFGVLYHRIERLQSNQFALWKENQERWLECSLQIKEILMRMEKQ